MEFGSPKSENSFGASTLDIKKHVQMYLIGRNPESFQVRVTFMSTLNDFGWTKKKAIRKPVSTMPMKWQHWRQKINSGHYWCFLGPASDKTWWNGNPNDNETVSHCRWLTYSSVTLHIQYFQRQNHYRLDNCGTDEEMTTSKSHLRTRRFSPIPYWQAIYCVFAGAFSSGMITSESREADSQSFRTV